MRKTLDVPADDEELTDPTATAALDLIKDQLRATWKMGEGWRLEFGRQLIQFREVAPHGVWISFLESEFGLNRQTAYNWMNKAKEADGIKLDAETVNTDEPDTHAETVSTMIDEEREKVNEALKRDLNGPKSYRIIVEGVTEDEKGMFKLVMSKEHEWVQSILREAFYTIIKGKPMEPPTAEEIAQWKAEDEAEAAARPVITDDDLPFGIIVTQSENTVAAA